MDLTTRQLTLQLENPFKLSYGSTLFRENVLVSISSGEWEGIGEAAVVPYYGESPERVTAYISQPEVQQAIQSDPLLLHDSLSELPPGDSMSARAAVDIALHDVWGKALGQPLYRLWGLNPERTPVTSFTVGMPDSDADYRQRLHSARCYPLIKLKLGGGDPQQDLELVRIAREVLPDAVFCVDANAGWSAEQALKLIPRFEAWGVRFVEQPVAKTDLEGWRTLQAALPDPHIPLIADESVQGVESVLPLVGLADGINIKLAKCGGLYPARQMIMLARAFGMKVMLGCMVETSVAVTAAAHLAPLVDYADLDGNLLITNDPYRGVRVQDGKIVLPTQPGLGIEPVQ